MFDELRYRWRLRKYLKDYFLTRRVHALPLETPQQEGEPWPAPGSEDTELGVFMRPEVSHGETKVYAGVQA